MDQDEKEIKVITKFITTRTVRFSSKIAASDRLFVEVSHDNGDTWIPLNPEYAGIINQANEKEEINASWKIRSWGLPHVPAPITVADYDAFEGISYLCEHSWVDTGSRMTFCKKCNADGELDPMTNKVTVIFKSKEK